MIIEKITTEKNITVIKQQEFEILEATLLSIEEYEQYKKMIQPHEISAQDSWWLRSPNSYYDFSAGIVYGNGEVGHEYVDFSLGVCPALKISNLKSSDLGVGDKFEIGGYTFTVISDKYAHCNSIVGESVFREDWEAEDANDYEKSNIKKYVDEWFDKLKTKNIEKWNQDSREDTGMEDMER